MFLEIIIKEFKTEQETTVLVLSTTLIVMSRSEDFLFGLPKLKIDWRLPN